MEKDNKLDNKETTKIPQIHEEAKLNQPGSDVTYDRFQTDLSQHPDLGEIADRKPIT